MTMARFLAGRLPDDVERSLNRLAAADGVVHVAVMPDVHLAHEVCVGVVVATRDRLLPAAVGGDIGCGMLAARFDVASADALTDRTAAHILAGLDERVPCERHRRADFPGWPEGFPPALSAERISRLASREGRAHLGTLGSGNHFIELQADERGELWVAVHTGSRGLGPAIRDHHGGAGLDGLEADSPAGRAYLADHDWAVAFADANRALLLQAVASVLQDTVGAQVVPESVLTCRHNHVRREEHGGEPLWVHRKGAIPAGAGERGIIPGSMGAPTYHVVGRGHDGSLASSSHGAGRAMSRTEARRKLSSRDVERQLRGVWFDHRRLDALRDEAPAAYKDIGAVMRAQHDLTRIVRRLRPQLSFKGA